MRPRNANLLGCLTSKSNIVKNRRIFKVSMDFARLGGGSFSKGKKGSWLVNLFEGGARQQEKKDICELKQTKHNALWIVLIMFHVTHVMLSMLPPIMGPYPSVQHTHTCGQSTCASTRFSPIPGQGALPPWSVGVAARHVVVHHSESPPSRPPRPWQQTPPTTPCTHLPMACPPLDGSRALVQPAATVGPRAMPWQSAQQPPNSMRTCPLAFALSAPHFPGRTVRATFRAPFRTPYTMLAAVFLDTPPWVTSTRTIPLTPAMASHMTPCAPKSETRRSAGTSRNTPVKRTLPLSPSVAHISLPSNSHQLASCVGPQPGAATAQCT